MNVLIEEQVEAFEKSEVEFEKLIMIHRPEIWQKMQEEKQEARDMGFDEIVWKTPESLEEFEEIERQLGRLDDLEVVETKTETAATYFHGIELDELGDE